MKKRYYSRYIFLGTTILAFILGSIALDAPISMGEYRIVESSEINYKIIIEYFIIFFIIIFIVIHIIYFLGIVSLKCVSRVIKIESKEK